VNHSYIVPSQIYQLDAIQTSENCIIINNGEFDSQQVREPLVYKCYLPTAMILTLILVTHQQN